MNKSKEKVVVIAHIHLTQKPLRAKKMIHMTLILN